MFFVIFWETTSQNARDNLLDLKVLPNHLLLVALLKFLQVWPPLEVIMLNKCSSKKIASKSTKIKSQLWQEKQHKSGSLFVLQLFLYLLILSHLPMSYSSLQKIVQPKQKPQSHQLKLASFYSALLDSIKSCISYTSIWIHLKMSLFLSKDANHSWISHLKEDMFNTLKIDNNWR